MKKNNIFQIILAGGRSSRMGSPKGLIEVDGKSIIEWHIENFHYAIGGESIVVLGHYTDEYYNQVKDLSGVTTVTNLNYHLGQYSSIQVGIMKALELGATAVFVMPVDVPPVQLLTYNEIIKALGAHSVVKPKFQEQSGHPILITKKILKKLVEIDPQDSDARLDIQLKNLSLDEITWVELDDENIVKNYNTPEDIK